MTMLEQDEPMDDSDTSGSQPMEVDDTTVGFGSNSENLPCSNDPVSVCAKALEEFVQQPTWFKVTVNRLLMNNHEFLIMIFVKL